MLVAAFASRRPDRMVWPDRTWEWAGLRPENGSFERDGSLDVEARDRWFAQAIVASPAMFRRAVGQGSLYWLAHRDADGGYLNGGRSYRLTVPLPVPAALFWSVTCYDAQTRSEVVADQGQAALRSLFEDLAADGASQVDLHFGPEQARRGRPVDPDRARPGLVLLLPHLRPQPGRVRRQLAARRLHPGLETLHSFDERHPLAGAEHQRAAVRVLGVAHRATRVRQHGDLDTVTAVTAAVTALAPGGVAQVVHCSSATFRIKSREAPRGSASARTWSKISLIFATADGRSII